MNSVLGTVGLVVSLAGAIAGIFQYLWGIHRQSPATIRSARGMVVLVALGALASTVAMQHALLTHDFSLVYVAENSSKETPLLYQITGMWSSLAGSILLWAAILSGYLLVVALRARRRDPDAAFAWTMVVGLVVAAFFFALMLHSANPFITTAHPLVDGAGPNPLLQDYPLVAFHPPMLYLGYVGFTIPFAFGIASLITGRSDMEFARQTRYWALIAWVFLTLGIFLGAWWSYQVLGWGGYWAWDPVENAAFLPWLCGTAYLHSSMSANRGGNLRIWNISLLVATFCLTILGTFFTRSGVLQSVHSFSGSTLGPDLIGFFAFASLVSIGLIAWRLPMLRSGAFSRVGISRDAAFIINNLLFSALAAVILLGTTFPLLAQAVNGEVVSVGPPFFNSFSAPLALALLFFMTVSPFLPARDVSWRLAFEKVFPFLAIAMATVLAAVVLGLRDKGVIAAYGFGAFALSGAVSRMVSQLKRLSRGSSLSARAAALGSSLAHLGVGIVAIALATSTAFGVRTELKLSPFSSGYFQGHRFTYQGVTTLVTPSRSSLRASILIDGTGPYLPQISQFGTNTQVIGTPSVKTGITEDIYLTLDSPPQSSGGAVMLGVVVEPLVSWLWVGGAVMGVGGLASVAQALGRRPRRSLGAGVRDSELDVVPSEAL